MIYIVISIVTSLIAMRAQYYNRLQSDKNIQYSYSKFLDKRKTMYMFLIFFVFLGVASLRYYVGTDYGVYVNLQIPEVLSGDYRRVEWLYKYIIIYGFRIGGNQFIFFVTHLIFLAFLFLSINKNAYNLTWSVFLITYTGFFNYSLNIMRQAIACAIFLFAINFIRERKFIPFLLLMLLGTGFHKTAILFIPFYFLSYFQVNQSVLYFITISLYFLQERVRALIMWFSIRFNFYTNYFGSDFDSVTIQKDLFFIMFLITICTSIMIFFGKSENNKDSAILSRFYLNSSFVTLFIAVLSGIIPNSTRIFYMSFCIQILSIPFFFKRIKDKYLKLYICLILCVIFVALFIRLIFIRNMGETLPYRTIFGE